MPGVVSLDFAAYEIVGMHDADVDLGLTSLPTTTRRNVLSLVFPAVTRTAHARSVVLAHNLTLNFSANKTH